MTTPSVRITKVDGSMGVLPASAGRLPAFVGPTEDGPVNTPATFGRVSDLVGTFLGGPTVEAAAHYIDRFARPVVISRTAASNDGTVSAVTSESTGTSAVTADEESAPIDDHELVVWFTKGGTVGQAGIIYRVSSDGGRNFDPATPLGTAQEITVGGVTFNLGAGTVVAGDRHAVTTTAPNWTGPELSAALEALGQSKLPWELLNVVGPMDPAALDIVNLKIEALEQRGKPRAWVGHVRMSTPGETSEAYRTALEAAWASKAVISGSLCAGAGKLISGVSGRQYRRPLSFAYGALTASVSEEVNVADVNIGQLTGFSIADVNGSPDEHDEELFPGLDDLRFVTARTWGDSYEGVYITRPRIFAPAGSDFQIMPRVRVMNLARVALNIYFGRRLNVPLLVSESTGFLLETEALEIEAGARAAMAAVLRAKPKASSVDFKLSRTDNVLSTSTLTGGARIVGLAYPEVINLTLGYWNPALQIQKVAA